MTIVSEGTALTAGGATSGKRAPTVSAAATKRTRPRLAGRTVEVDTDESLLFRGPAGSDAGRRMLL